VPTGIALYHEEGHPEATPGTEAFIIVSGRVKLTKRNQMIGLRTRGATNGATALVMSGDARSSTVSSLSRRVRQSSTVEDSLIMSLSYERLKPVLHTEPEVRAGMMGMLVEQLFEAYGRMNVIKKHSREMSYFRTFHRARHRRHRSGRRHPPMQKWVFVDVYQVNLSNYRAEGCSTVHLVI
jgi:CRP-like cAMP-binding protein